MTGVWSKFSLGSPPLEEMREMRGGMLKVLAETWDEYMRTPQFMEMMKASLNGALDLKRMARDGMNRVHEQFENPSKKDIDGVLLAIRHVEGRLLDRLEGLDDRVAKLDEKIDKVDQRIARQENATGCPALHLLTRYKMLGSPKSRIWSLGLNQFQQAN